uniref:Conotoxin n=1 Tax=Conus praecellens TaxID=128530 RepID=A0A291C2K1_CONPC|nr:conotoxin [Conus praecellens]
MKVSSVLIVAMPTLAACQLIGASSHYSQDVQMAPSVRSADEMENSENAKLSKRICLPTWYYCGSIIVSPICCTKLCLFSVCFP